MASPPASQNGSEPDAPIWICSVCLEDIPSTIAAPFTTTTGEGETAETHNTCTDCLRAQFLSAQDSEASYPVKWQSHVLHPRDFPNVFDYTFVRAYEAKEREYRTPALKRVYCECGVFVDQMVAPEAKSSWVSAGSGRVCKACEARWCLRCAQKCKGLGVKHDCKPEMRLSERRLALGGLKKGRKYQVCPGEGCGRIIELEAACNAIKCECGAEFCFLCGIEANGRSDHWTVEGGCPRWGFIGSGRELFDAAGGGGDDDDDDDIWDDDEGLEAPEPWERGEGEPTLFNFYRWAWSAAMFEGTGQIYEAQLRIIRGEGTLEQQQQDVNEVEAAMKDWNIASQSGIDRAAWQALVDTHEDGVEDWILEMFHLNWDQGGIGRERFGGPLLDFPPHAMFNVTVAADREDGARWAREASASTVVMNAAIENGEENGLPAFPGSAVFDIGPGGADGESWNLREMEMFEGLPGLGFFKLAGHALLVIPQVEIFDELDAQIAGVDMEDRVEVEEEEQAEVPQENLEAEQIGEQPADMEEPRPDGPIMLYVVGTLFALLTILIDLVAWVFRVKMG